MSEAVKLSEMPLIGVQKGEGVCLILIIYNRHMQGTSEQLHQVIPH